MTSCYAIASHSIWRGSPNVNPSVLICSYLGGFFSFFFCHKNQFLGNGREQCIFGCWSRQIQNHHVSNALWKTLFEKRSKKKEKRETISNCIIIITGNRWYSWDHMQSTLAGSLQYLSPLSIVSTLNEQRKRSNLNESLELNFRINFSRRTSMFSLILLTFDFRFDNRHTYINVLSIRHDSLFFQVSVWVLDPTVKFLYCLWRYSTDKSLSSR